MVNWLESTFPGLAGSAYSVTSPPDKTYNCIAWAAGDNKRYWWPVEVPDFEYWPPEVPLEETLERFEQAFATIGYAPCESEVFEQDMEKVALFADEDSFPTHAARQLLSGRWTSKLGKLEDIEHDLHDLERQEYGKVVRILSRNAANGVRRSSKGSYAMAMATDSAESIEQRFQRLAKERDSSTRYMSSMNRAAAHPAYQEIIALGKEVVPFLLRDLEHTHQHWFIAIHEITHADPIPLSEAGCIPEMINAWLEWARNQGIK